MAPPRVPGMPMRNSGPDEAPLPGVAPDHAGGHPRGVDHAHGVAGVARLHLGGVPPEVDHQAPDPAVADQEVGAAADHAVGHPEPAHQRQGGGEVRGVRRLEPGLGRAADGERGVARQGLVGEEGARRRRRQVVPPGEGAGGRGPGHDAASPGPARRWSRRAAPTFHTSPAPKVITRSPATNPRGELGDGAIEIAGVGDVPVAVAADGVDQPLGAHPFDGATRRRRRCR